LPGDGTPPGLKQIKTCFWIGFVESSSLFFSSKRFDAKKKWMVQPLQCCSYLPGGDLMTHLMRKDRAVLSPQKRGGLGPLGTPKVGVSAVAGHL